MICTVLFPDWAVFDAAANSLEMAEATADVPKASMGGVKLHTVDFDNFQSRVQRQMAWCELSDGVPLWYEDRGSGPIVLLIPGWTFTTRMYEAQVDNLSRDHRVIAVDLRGAGNSGKTPQGHSLGRYAVDVLELVEHLKLEDITIVGWAMGVAVAIHAIARNPVPFTGFVWCDHSPCFYVAPDWPYVLGGDLDPWAWDDQLVTSRSTGDEPAGT